MKSVVRSTRNVLVAWALLLCLALPAWSQGIPTRPQIAAAIQQLGAKSAAERKAARELLTKHAVRAWAELNGATKAEDPEVRLSAAEIIGKMPAAAKARAEKEAGKKREKEFSEKIGGLVAAGPDGWKKLDALVQEKPKPGKALLGALWQHHWPQHLIVTQAEAADVMVARCLARMAEAGAPEDYVAFHALRGTLSQAIRAQKAKGDPTDGDWGRAWLFAGLYRAAGRREELLQTIRLRALRLVYGSPQRALTTEGFQDEFLASLPERPAVAPGDPIRWRVVPHKMVWELNARLREGNTEQIDRILAGIAASPGIREDDDKWRGPAKVLAANGMIDPLRALAKLSPNADRWARRFARVSGQAAEERRLIGKLADAAGGGKETPPVDKPRASLLPSLREARSFLVAHNVPLPPWLEQHPELRYEVARVAALDDLARRHALGKDIWPSTRQILANEGLGIKPWDVLHRLFGKSQPGTRLMLHSVVSVNDPGKDPVAALRGMLSFDPATCSGNRWREIWAPKLRRLDAAHLWFYSDPSRARPLSAELDRASAAIQATGVAGSIIEAIGSPDQPGSAAQAYVTAEWHRREERFAEAEKGYRHVLEIRPIYAPARVRLSRCLARQGKLTEADRELKTARLLPLGRMSSRHSDVLHALEKLGQREDVEKECRLGAALGDRDVLLGAHVRHLGRNGDYARAARVGLPVQMRMCLHEYTLSEALEGAARICRWRGRAALAVGRMEEAARELGRAGRIHAVEPFEITEDLALLAKAGAKKGRERILKYHLQRLRANLAAMPESPLCHRRLAWFLAVTGTDPKEALSLANRALELKGKADADCLDVLAEAHFRLGRGQEAIAAARKAIALTPPPGPPTWEVDHYHLPTPWDLRTARLKRLRAAK